HDFDLHIYVGIRSWPDDIEKYCEVTYPGVDAQHPIKIKYMDWKYDLEEAIQRATADIAKYMDNPRNWTEEYVEHQGTDWEKLRAVEEEIEKYQQELAMSQQWVTRYQDFLMKAQEKAQELRKK